MGDMTAEERARLLLDKHFVRDEIAGYIPMHYNQFEKDLPEQIRQAEQAAYERAAKVAETIAGIDTHDWRAATAAAIRALKEQNPVEE